MFDDFDFDDTHESEPNDCNPYELESNDYPLYESEPDASSLYDAHASRLDDASEESQDGILGDSGGSPFFPAFGTAPSEELDSTGAKENASTSSSNRGDDPVAFGSFGRCRKCDCQSFEWPISGNICQNCYHHYDEHL